MPYTRTSIDGWTSVQVAAEHFDVTERTIRNWIRSGQIEGIRVGPRLWRVPTAALYRRGDS